MTESLPAATPLPLTQSAFPHTNSYSNSNSKKPSLTATTAYIKPEPHLHYPSNLSKEPCAVLKPLNSGANTSVAEETKAVLSELMHQSTMRTELDKRLSDLERDHGLLLNENMHLRQMVEESANKQAYMQEKMEKIFRFVYMYMNGGSLPPQLMSRPSLLLTDVPIPKYIEGPPLSPINVDMLSDPSKLELMSASSFLADEFGFGFDLRHQNSFESAAASVTPPSDKVPSSLSPSKPPTQHGHSMKRMNGSHHNDQIDLLSPSVLPLTDLPDNLTEMFSMENDLSGTALKRLASVNEYKTLNGWKDNGSFEFNSDRVTELSSNNSFDGSSMSMSNINKRTAEDGCSVNSVNKKQKIEGGVGVEECLSRGENDQVPVVDVEAIIQPQLQYVELIQRNQENTLARMDSLEHTIATLWNEGYDSSLVSSRGSSPTALPDESTTNQDPIIAQEQPVKPRSSVV